ncbi:MAG: hypothetical protein SNI45_06905 [Rikenellaceae bacterium]
MRRRGLALLLLLLVIALSLLCSCASTKVVAAKQTDSVRIQIVERLVVVRDTVEVEIPKIVERTTAMQDSSYLSNDYARSSAVIRPDGGLFHSLETIPQRIRSPTENKVGVRDSIVYREIEITNTVEVERQLTAWQQWRLNGFWVLLTIVLVIAYIKLSKII